MSQALGQGFPIFDLAFPNYEHIPSTSLESVNRLPVPLHGTGKLWQPIVGPGSRQVGKAATFVLMPEATMHEDHLPTTRKDDVWSAGQIPPIDPESVSKPMRELPNLHFGLAARLADSRHSLSHWLGNVRKGHGNGISESDPSASPLQLA